MFILFLVFQVYSFNISTNLFNAILLLILSSYLLLFNVVRNMKLYPMINVDFLTKIKNVKEHATMLLKDYPDKFHCIKNATVLIIDEVSSMSQDLFSFIYYLVKYIKEGQDEETSQDYWDGAIKNFLVILVGDVMQNLPIPLKDYDINLLRGKGHTYKKDGDLPFFTSPCFYKTFDIGMLFSSHHRGEVDSTFVKLCLKARTNKMNQDDLDEFMKLIGGAVFEPFDTLAPESVGGKGDDNMRMLIATANQMARFKIDRDEALIVQRKFLFKDRLDACTSFALSPRNQPVVPAKLKILTGERDIISKYATFPKEGEAPVDQMTIRYACDDFMYASGNECIGMTERTKATLKG